MVLQINLFLGEAVLLYTKLINNELIRTWHEAHKVLFEKLSKYLPEETKDIHNNVINVVNLHTNMKNQHFPNISQKQYHLSPNSFSS